MPKISLSIILFFFLNSFFIQAQNAPGGINTNNVIWLRADSGISYTGSTVSTWQDQSINGNDATQTDTNYQPTLNANMQNYNPGVYFDGTANYMDINDLISPTNTKLAIFAVGTNEAGGDLWHAMVAGQTDSQWTSGGYGLCSYNGNANFGLWINRWNINAATTYIGSATMQAAILEGEYNSTNLFFYKDTALNSANSYTGTVGDGGGTFIGGASATANSHKGHIAEVIIYDRDLTNLERQKINSYLAIKYGITASRFGINDNYLSSNATSIYTGNSSNQYWHGIIGIGRDDISFLNQKQSKEVNDNSRIYLGNIATNNNANNNTISTDIAYIVMGHDLGFRSATINGNTEKPSGVSARLEREWKLTNTNFNETFNIDIKLNICVDLPPINPNDLRLLIDGDDDFSNAQIVDSSNGITFTVNGNIISVAGLNSSHFPINNTKYFTIASINDTTLANNFKALPVQNIHTCDINQNGIADFTIDLNSIENQVIGNQTGLTVSYYDHLGNPLNLTSTFTNTVAYNQTITARVTNSYGCYEETTFHLITDALPLVDNHNDTVNCVSFILPPLTNGNYFTGSQGTGTPLYAGNIITNSQTIYIYSNDGTCSNETDFVVTINPLPPVTTISDLSICGEYILPAIANGSFYSASMGTGTHFNVGDSITSSQIIYIYNNDGNCENETSFNITIFPIIPFDLSQSNLSINQEDLTITMNDQTINYLYQVDNYSYQPNNYFYDLGAGTHLLNVKDENGCVLHSIPFEIILFNIPKYFSPNGDGYNDYWEITDSANSIISITIYDRYGKMLKYIEQNSSPWDGTFNNRLLPSASYWYLIKTVNNQEIRGYFNLKR